MPLTEGLISRKICYGPPKQGHMEKRLKKKTSYSTALKFNPDEPRDADGKWTTGGAGGIESTAKLTPAQHVMQEELAKQDKKPVHKVKTPEEGVALILKGENVEIEDTKDVHTILKKLGELALQAKAEGKDAKNWDPCAITVKGTSLFCSEKIRTKEFPHGIPRIEMPQFKSKNPTPGSEADDLPRKDGEVDGSREFMRHLIQSGVKIYPKVKILARKLKASQAEMEGVKVAGMMLSDRNPKVQKIWVSRDGYVIDGHHTWAAAVGRDAADGNLDNDKKMEVVVVDMPMSKVYHVAVKWTREFGLPAAGVKKYDLILRAS